MRKRLIFAIAASLTSLAGCSDHRQAVRTGTTGTAPDFRPADQGTALLTGWTGLDVTPVDIHAIRHQLRHAFANSDDGLLRSLEQSERWLRSSEGANLYSHRGSLALRERLRESLRAFRAAVEESNTPDDFVERMDSDFVMLAASGRAGTGEVLFTGYFAPEYAAAMAPDDRFRYPVYRLPDQFKNDMVRGEAMLEFSRAAIESSDLLHGYEIAWLDDELNRYLLHVNGSGRLHFSDGSMICLSYVATNNLTYTSLGRLLIDAGYSTADEMSMQKIREIYESQPEVVRELMLANDRYVFFDRASCDDWPRSALSTVLTPMRSVATDHDAFPPGGLVFVSAPIKDDRIPLGALSHFMLNQDTGGAIVGPGRCDVFTGVGEAAGEIAGRLKAIGSLYYVLLKE